MIDAFLKILSGAIVVVLLVGCSNDTPENSQVAEVDPQVTPEPVRFCERETHCRPDC